MYHSYLLAVRQVTHLPEALHVRACGQGRVCTTHPTRLASPISSWAPIASSICQFVLYLYQGVI